MRAFLLGLLCISSSLWATQVSDLIDENGQLTPSLIKLVNTCGIYCHQDKDKCLEKHIHINSYSIESLEPLVQGRDPNYKDYCWIRKGERWEAKSAFIDEKSQDHVIECVLKTLKMGEAVPLKRISYEGLVLFGTTVGMFHKNLDYSEKVVSCLKKQMKDLFVIYLLTGRRPLADFEKKDPFLENNKENILKYNEKEALELILKDSSLSQKYPVNVINDEALNQKRATTHGTLHLFLKGLPEKPAFFLGVSSPLFALYQELVAKRTLAENKRGNVEIDVVSDALDPDIAKAYTKEKIVGILLDNIARIIYEICQYKKITNIYPLK